MAALTLLPEIPAVGVVRPMTGMTIAGQLDFLRDRRLVAGLAGDPLMGAVQGKIGLLVMVECPHAPPVRVVTLPAGRSQPVFVRIVFLVARGAFEFGILESGREVALLARYDGVQTDQGETGQVVVEGHFFFPALFIVTSLAALSFLPLVDVVCLVTGKAIDLEFLFIYRPFMAIPALKFAVPPAQGKVGIAVMVEGGFLPVRRRVTLFTFFSVLAFMRIVLPVTSLTLPLQLYLLRVLAVATLALDLAVFAFQAEFRIPVMIELDFFPRLRGMTGVAFPAEMSAMHVIELMAGIAAGGYLFIALIRMATVASRFPVFVFQRESSLVVIEGVFFPHVLFMAIGALLA